MSDRTLFLRECDLLKGSYFFDDVWYRTTYQDVGAAGVDPVEHYLEYGWKEGRNPGPFFNTEHYLAAREDVRDAGMNPLLHFLRHGISEFSGDFRDLGVFLAEPAVEAATPLAAPSATGSGLLKTGPVMVFVTHDMNIGGAPVLVRTIGEWFQKHTEFDVRFVSMGGGPLHDSFSAIAPTHIVGSIAIPDEWAPGARDTLREFLGSEPIITFANSVASGDYFKINPYSTPVVSYIHEMGKVLDMFPAQLEQIVGKAAHIFSGGGTVTRFFRDVAGVSEDRLTERPAFIPFAGGDPGFDPAAKRRMRRRLSLPQQREMVVACGVAHWRKQPEVFVRLAADLVLRRGRDASFVWIGGGEDVPAMEALALELGIADRVHFIGFRDDFRDYIAAADVFALTSMEDPFPLVCLDAALAYTPSVVFREATGMVSLIEPEGEAPAGIAVPIDDNTAYFDAVDRLLEDEELRGEMAKAARSRTLERYTDAAACPQILDILRTVGGFRPRISVVVPNYNCGPYLRERLDSIANQTFKDVEVLLLDDKSTDGSESILVEYARANPTWKLMLAERNGGSVFAAWERGLNATTGEIIWITEADDFCEPNFLATAIRAFDTTGVHLVHGRSIPVNEQSTVVGDWNDLYLDRISPGRWRQSFVRPAAKEVHEALGRGNTIPNASGVLFRRESAMRAIVVARTFKLAGDWAFYLAAIAGGRVAYVHEAVNYHRRHSTTVTKSLEGSKAYFQELADVGALVRRLFGPHAEREAAFKTFLEQEAARFQFPGAIPDGRLPASISPERPPAVLYGVGDLSGGGAQMFAIRFVNQLVSGGAGAVLVTMGQEADHPASISRVAKEIPVVTRAEIDAVGLTQFMSDWGLDAIVTGHWWADRQMGHWLDLEPDHPWVVIMHGCYDTVVEQPHDFPGHEADFAAIDRNCDCFVWTAPKNRTVFERGILTPRRSMNIVNGFEPLPPSTANRRDFGLPEDALVFTLASRAIESKGWLRTLEAFQQVRALAAGRRDVRLQLIGDGPVADKLAGGPPIDGVHLVRHTARLGDYIAISDVCLLPSWFSGESLPLVLIEFLAQGKPAIVSDIGNCAWAIDADSRRGPAGTVVERIGGEVPLEALVVAMNEFVDDENRAKALEVNARKAFKKFDMTHMMARYRQLIDELV